MSGAASRAIKGTEYEARLKNGYDDHQYNRWVDDNDEDLRRGKCRPLETDRLKWGTSENILTHQLCVAETLVLNGAAVWNPDFDHTKPEDEMIKVTHPQLVISFDESEASLDGTDDSLTALRLAPGSSRNPTDLKGQDEKRREKEEAEKVAKRAEKEQAKKEDLAKKVALGVDLLRSEKWEEAKTKASNTASQVDPAKFQQEVNRTFKDDEIRAIIISRMEQPAKGKKADRLAQLMELLQAAPAPLMLTNHA